MAAPSSGCPVGLQLVGGKKSTMKQRSLREMCWWEQSRQRTKCVWNFLLHCPHLKKSYKTGSHWLTKSPRQQVKWVELNRDKVTATLARAYSLFYKNSGIEITWLSPNNDILIRFCIQIKILVKCSSIMQSRSLTILEVLSIHCKSLSLMRESGVRRSVLRVPL